MLRVSDNQRYLVHEDGRPFFYLADTAWELFHRLNREQVKLYLGNRADKGFTAIQAVALAELDGLTVPNAYGHLPLEDKDPARPIEAYFEHVDFIVGEAERLAMHIALLPTWGRWATRAWAVDEPIFTPDNARAYGRFLGDRYRDRSIIWVLGGDRPVEPKERDRVMAIWRAMAEGIRDGGSRGLMTFHPPGRTSSSRFVHEEPWLDFNMLQSGHSARAYPNWRMLRADYERTPIKPVLDGEPCYENHPIAHSDANGRFGEHDVRWAAYWSVFAGAFGHTYGCHDVWMMRTPDWAPIRTGSGYWYDSIDLPGAAQMGHLRRLVESRPFLTRIPDHAASDALGGCDSDHVQITRDGDPGPDARNATWIMIYAPLVRAGWTKYDTSAIGAGRLRVWRFNPRTGDATLIDERDNTGSFAAPAATEGPDWVWVLDDADAGYPAPGAAGWRAG